jgi:hypothetical protein
VRRRDIEREIARLAKAKGLTAEWREGGRHSVVVVGRAQVSVPRHREVAEATARRILRDIDKEA